ncbi:MAG: hypothetical protein HYZ42_02325, partial [Bacteroidetes bacterium]|nr:hypothetical protein [Bacteroidota bacterium]
MKSNSKLNYICLFNLHINEKNKHLHSYINFNKVTFKPLGAMFNFATAIWIDSNGTTTSSYNNFYGCRIGANWGITNKNYSCAYINGNQTFTTFVRDTFYNASCAIYVDGNRNGGNYTEGLVIDSNYFFPSGNDVFEPFYIRYVKDVKITHNQILKNGCCADRMGEFYGVRIPFEMSYNKFYYQTGSSSGNGFSFDSLNLYNDGGVAKIYNNFFSSNHIYAGTMLKLSRAADVSVVHNNFYHTASNSSFSIFETYATDSTHHNNIEILNNSIITNGAVVLNVTGSNLAIAKKAISNINFNNIHRPFSNFQVIYNVYGNKINNSGNLADAIYTGSDASTGFFASKYVNSNNLHLSNTNCMNGTAISYITDDIDGETRNTPPTIGADEVSNGTMQNDIGIVGVIQPSSSSYSAGSQDIIVLVKNYGSNTVTSFNTKYSINGSAPVSVSYSGSLGTCDTVSIVFTGANQYNFSSGSYYMTVYTDSVNNGVDSNAVNDTIVKTYCVPLSGNYTVDGSSALSSSNFQNFTQLANTLNNCGISGPVNVSVAAGTYSEHIVLGAINGNDTNNTITIDGGVNGASTRIIKAKAYNSAVNYLVRLDGVNAIQFRNITFSSDSGTTGILLHSTSGTKLQVKHCVFDYNGTAATSTNNNLQAIMISSGYSTQLSASNLLITEIDSNTFKNGYYGVVANYNNYLNTIYIRNNTFTGTLNSCIYIFTGTVKILDNKLEQRNGFGGNGAIYLYNLNPYNANYFNQINNNNISKVSNYGINVYFCTGGYNSLKGEIYNNMIGGTFSNTGQIAGLYIYYSNQWKIYNNSISIASTNASANRGVYVSGSGSYKTQFKNNSIAINTSTANNAICMMFTDTSFADTNGVNYNNYYNASSSDIINIKNTTYDNTNYNSAFPYGGGAQSFEGDPMYNSAVDLHVSGLQLSDRGAALGVPDDYDHQTRSATMPDIGADEFYATTYRDFSMYALLSPVSNGGCMGGYNQTITATLANIGVDTIDLTTDTAWVSAKVTGPTGNITTYGPIAVTGKTFYPKDTMNIDITYTFDMSDEGTYNIAPFVAFANDTNPMNDTLMNQYLDANNPVAVLSSLPKTSICNGDSVKLSAANSKNVTDFIWFQDGNPLYASTDSVYYATAVGEYFCMITNNSGCIATTDTIKITAGTNPTAAFTANRTSFCNGDSAHLSAVVNANYNYQWLYNNNVIVGATDTFYEARNAGTYTLKAIDKNSSCFDIASAINISINASPTATISYIGSNIKCAGDSLKLSSNPASGLTYEWIYNNT